MTADRKNLSYCFQPHCQDPENNSSSIKCECCGASLLLQNRYRAIKIIAKTDIQRTFKAIDSQDSLPYYCIVEQFSSPINKEENTAKYTAIETEIFQKKFQKLNDRDRIARLLRCFIEDEYQYLVKEFIPGHNISQELAAYGAFKENEVRQLLLDVLPLLKSIHSQEIIHRNLRPENIVRCQKDRKLVLVNFGLASLANPSSYSAPEQIQGIATYASDLYSLGIICIQLLTQIKRKNILENRDNILNWRIYLQDEELISESLGKIIDRMVEESPQKRYQSAAEILKDLNPPSSLIESIPFKSSAKAAIAIVLALLATRYLLMPARTAIDGSKYISYTNAIAKTKIFKNSSQNAILLAILDGKIKPLSLQSVKVKTRISGNIAIAQIEQTFTNPYNKPIEAVYQFFPAAGANINGINVKIGNNNFQGQIFKKAEAIRLANLTIKGSKAVNKYGKKTGAIALMQQSENQLITNSIKNILPGQTVKFEMLYSSKVEFIKGKYQYHFPVNVLPKSKGKIALNKNDFIDIVVEIDGGMSIYDVNSSSHKIAVRPTSLGVKIELISGEDSRDRDFILSYKLSSIKTSAKVPIETRSKGNYFNLRLISPKRYYREQIIPKNFVFVIDTSSLKSKNTLEKYRELTSSFIANLRAEDTFNIINAADNTKKLAERALKNTSENRKIALEYINNLQARGNKKLTREIERDFNLSNDSKDRLSSVILITNPLSNNSGAIINAIQKSLKTEQNFYTFAIVPASDRFLFDGLARIKLDNLTVIKDRSKISEVVEKFIREINQPLLTNIKLDWIGSGEKPEIYPLKIPNLIADRSVSLYGFKQDGIPGKLKITGDLAEGKKYQTIVEIDFSDRDENPFISERFLELIPRLWGLAKIEELSDRSNFQAREKILTETAIKHQILSEDTAFIAIATDEE